jgi:(E)-4-hydroxy-3-methylbut-2-enyl-diphosphate synthase
MKKTRQILCGGVPIGGGATVSIQSMTNTKTEDVNATVDQILRLQEAGCEIIRCAVPTMEAAAALEKIREKISLPLVADIHFDYRLAVAAIEAGVDKVRINRGNIGDDDRVFAVVEAAKKRAIPIRIGVNSGSLEKDLVEKNGGVTAEGLAESALRNVRRVEAMGFEDIVVSMKSSDVRLNYEAHRILRDQVDYPFHIGITESGSARGGMVKSAAGLGALLINGIGDTLRVSLTGDPVKEIGVAKDILKACGCRAFGVNLVSCPTCGRTKVDLEQIVDRIERETAGIDKDLTVAVMGCEVNGPGEAKEADCGLAFGTDKAAVFCRGEILETAETEKAIGLLMELIRSM